jgi:hypothetical protein
MRKNLKTNNKTRANNWERQSARVLSTWLSRGKRKDLFWRTNSSGAKGARTHEKNHSGDIVAVDSKGKWFQDRFLIESKWKKDFSFESETEIKKWIKRYSKTAKDVGKELFLMVKGKKGVIYVLFAVNSISVAAKAKYGICSSKNKQQVKKNAWLEPRINRSHYMISITNKHAQKKGRGRPRKETEEVKKDKRMAVMTWIIQSLIKLKEEDSEWIKMRKDYAPYIKGIDPSKAEQYINYYAKEYARKTGDNISSIEPISLEMIKKLHGCYEQCNTRNGAIRVSLLKKALEDILIETRNNVEWQYAESYKDFERIFKRVIRTESSRADKSEWFLIVGSVAFTELTGYISAMIRKGEIRGDKEAERVLENAKECFGNIISMNKYLTLFAKKVKDSLPREISSAVDSLKEIETEMDEYNPFIFTPRNTKVIEKGGKSYSILYHRHFPAEKKYEGEDDYYANERCEYESIKLRAKPKAKLKLRDTDKTDRIRKTVNAMNAVADIAEVEDEMRYLSSS